MREDPEEAAKKEKQKKSRAKASARPLTAKKKKSDMVTGDLVNMVQTMGAQQKADASTKKNKKEHYPKAKGLVKDWVWLSHRVRWLRKKVLHLSTTFY